MYVHYVGVFLLSSLSFPLFLVCFDFIFDFQLQILLNLKSMCISISFLFSPPHNSLTGLGLPFLAISKTVTSLLFLSLFSPSTCCAVAQKGSLSQ